MRAKNGQLTDKDKLALAMRALDYIYRVAGEADQEYPERIGRIKAEASLALHRCGEPLRWEEWNKQLRLPLLGDPPGSN